MEYYRGLRAQKGEEAKTDPLQCYSNAIRLDPNQADFYVARAGCYREKELPLAIKDLDRAIALAPKWDYLHYQQGLYYCRMNAFEQAENDFNTAIKARPENKQYYSGLALANLCRGKNDEALKSIDCALATDHAVERWKYQRGIILTRSGRKAEAVKQFSKTAVFTKAGSHTVYFDGEREHGIMSKLSIRGIVDSWREPVETDPYYQ